MSPIGATSAHLPPPVTQPAPASKPADRDGDEATESGAQKRAETVAPRALDTTA